MNITLFIYQDFQYFTLRLEEESWRKKEISNSYDFICTFRNFLEKKKILSPKDHSKSITKITIFEEKEISAAVDNVYFLFRYYISAGPANEEPIIDLDDINLYAKKIEKTDNYIIYIYYPSLFPALDILVHFF